jgi:hypothetical protein
MDDWIETTVEKAKALFEGGTWSVASVTPKGAEINKAELYVCEGAPPKGYLLVSHFYNKVVVLDQRLNVLATFAMEDEVMGSYSESYEAGQGGLPQKDPFEGL